MFILLNDFFRNLGVLLVLRILMSVWKASKSAVLTALVLGTDRVEQMTKTYNDIDMVTHLLAEV